MLQEVDRNRISSSLQALGAECGRIATEHGWWDEPREVGTVMMLMVTELAEAYEEFRDGNALDRVYCNDGLYIRVYGKHNPIPNLTDTEILSKPEGQLVELADVLIRMIDTIEHEGLMDQFTSALWWKMRYNENRPWRHGGKTA